MDGCIQWDQLAVGVAAVVGLIYVARTLRRSNQDVLTFLEHQMRRSTKAQEDTAHGIQAAVDRLAGVEDRLDAVERALKRQPPARAS